MKYIVLMLAFGALVALAGCSGATSEPRLSSGGDQRNLNSATTDDAQVLAMPQDTTEQSPDRPATFSFNQASQVNATTLTVYYGSGSPICDGELARVEVEESPQTVTVTLHRSWTQVPEGPHLCPQHIMIHPVMIQLDAPFDDRTLIDGSTGQRVPLTEPPIPTP